ncbi:MFS transporter [Sphaerisporangium fuscum]|uniref:MFS transporter n=1 Tax=Sphaerisporangium fuscum TaxID=2835868 RepID=UPI001BDD5E3A|nr:MFS transporter [Sphaerisporangium fuscum]
MTLPFRLVRAATFAVVCLVLGVGAHVLGGGTLSAPHLAGGLVLAFGAALPLTGRERTIRVILPLLAAVQVALHVMFSSAHTGAHWGTGAHVHSGLVPDIGMLLMHGWAVTLTGLWLARGEALLWGLVRRLGVRLRRLLVAYLHPVYAPASPAACDPEPPVLRSAVLRHAVSRRGPPSAAAGAFA